MALARSSSDIKEYLLRQLLPAAGQSNRHIGSGTKFSEHANEAQSTQVFNFPKFGNASPPVTKVDYRKGVLLDFEVEICARFNQDIKSVEDFDSAIKGFFLCGDFTDRASLVRLIDPDNFDSGAGFSDAKSRHDFFPSGPFLVIPNDWEDFVKSERIMTHINGVPRQDARGSEMLLDFRALVIKVLG